MTLTTIKSNQSVYTNITIEEVRPTYHIVRATSKHFGENEVMYEGTSHKDALAYVKRLESEATPLFEEMTKRILVNGKKAFGHEGSVEGDEEGNSVFFDTNLTKDGFSYVTAVIDITNEEMTLQLVGATEEDDEYTEGTPIPFKRLTKNTIERALNAL